MDEIFGKVISILLAAMLFCMLPFSAMAQRQKNAAQMYLLSESTRFVDSICNTGFVSEQMLEQFYHQVSVLPQLCEIHIQHESLELVYDEKKEGYEYVSTYHDEEDIWNMVKKQEVYRFSKNDFVQVIITCKSGWSLIPGQEDATMNIRYGGVVKYEDQ